MTHNPVIGRFAPSPTGPLHFGSLIAAVASYVDARAAGGQWHLRIDDVDQTRCQPGAAADIQATLEAFGLHWDGPVQTQDGNRSRYQAVLETLIAAGRAYPCGCTRREVAAVGREGPAGMIYPGTCRAGLPPGREARSWRFRTEPGEWVIEDRHCPAITVNVWYGGVICARPRHLRSRCNTPLGYRRRAIYTCQSPWMRADENLAKPTRPQPWTRLTRHRHFWQH
jgi:glutamyl-Q tRNA(Asp) synthetase